jgi:hypothetical protein
VQTTAARNNRAVVIVSSSHRANIAPATSGCGETGGTGVSDFPFFYPIPNAAQAAGHRFDAMAYRFPRRHSSG